MVKLSRIIKKIVSKNSSTDERSVAVSTTPIESLVSKGKSQPTIDFTHLNIDEDNSKELISSNISGQYKPKYKVIKNRSGGISKTKQNEGRKSLIKNSARKKVLDKPLASSNMLSMTRYSESDPNVNTSAVNKQNNENNVMKTVKKVQSRGKRKRELRKELWRKRFLFKTEAKKIIEMHKSEDKHGKALGNLEVLKSQLKFIEESVRPINSSNKAILKNTKKYRQRSMMNSRHIYNESTKLNHS